MTIIDLSTGHLSLDRRIASQRRATNELHGIERSSASPCNPGRNRRYDHRIRQYGQAVAQLVESTGWRLNSRTKLNSIIPLQIGR
jgi:hypothetical protein